jgi:NAD(P)-dependent dehydrogenase (short-subunit alcohol dehydrogenase family)
MQLAGKVAFISGGGGGIGVGMAEAFLEKGMSVVLADIDVEHAQQAAVPFGDRAIALALDVTSPRGWNTARDAAIARFGPVDVLCNNAGISTPRMPLDEFSPEAFARVMAINLMGVHNGVAAFASGMRARRVGHIVNTSSMNGLIPFGTFGAYSASKFAVLGLSDALRQELAPHDVGVSTLFPGLTRSRMSLDPVVGADKGDIDRVALEANMMDPVWLGRAVVKAIEKNQPYIITHPEYKPQLEARCRDILDAFGEPAQPGYKTGRSATAAEKG